MALTTNLIAYYNLENVNDSVNSYTLTNYNTVTFTAAKYGNGANLGASNTNKYLERADLYGMTYVSDESFSCWVKVITPPAGVGASGNVFVSHFFATNPGNYRIIYYIYEGGVYKLLSNTGAKYIFNMGTTSFHHIVLTFSYSANQVKLYIDGTLAYTDPAFGSNYSAYTTSFDIGRFNNTSYASAIVDEVGVWNRILTSTEVTELYNGGVGKFYVGGSFITPIVVTAQPQMLLMFM